MRTWMPGALAELVVRLLLEQAEPVGTEVTQLTELPTTVAVAVVLADIQAQVEQALQTIPRLQAAMVLVEQAVEQGEILEVVESGSMAKAQAEPVERLEMVVAEAQRQPKRAVAA